MGKLLRVINKMSDAKNIQGLHSSGDRRRSSCAIACALDLFGDKWTLVIVRDLANGLTSFKDLLDSPESISSNILSSRLNAMIEAGFVEKYPEKRGGLRAHYRLTRSGMSVLGLLSKFDEWGLQNIPGVRSMFKPTENRPSSD